MHEPENISIVVDELMDNNIEKGKKTSDTLSPDLDLDALWLDQEESQLNSINENYNREPMESINVFYVYINQNQYIEKIISDKIVLTMTEDKSYSYLTKETLLQIIQTRKLKTMFSKYKLMDVISFVVDIAPEKIQSYSCNENSEQLSFLKTVSILDDLKFSNSIFIFHSVNSIYFLFEQTELTNHRHTLKSILRPANYVPNKIKSKKVSISLKNVEQGSHGRCNFTRKKTI